MGGDLAYERQCQKHIYRGRRLRRDGLHLRVDQHRGLRLPGRAVSLAQRRRARHRQREPDRTSSTTPTASTTATRWASWSRESMDEGSCVNDAMMLEGVYGSQYPATGQPLAPRLPVPGRRGRSGRGAGGQGLPALHRQGAGPRSPVYQPEDFRWNGFDPQADKLFKAERLRLLYVSTRRSQKMCESVLAHRMAQRLIAEGRAGGRGARPVRPGHRAASETSASTTSTTTTTTTGPTACVRGWRTTRVAARPVGRLDGRGHEACAGVDVRSARRSAGLDRRLTICRSP